MDELNKYLDKLFLDSNYNAKKGIHTFTMCKCNRKGYRTNKCNLCIKEELINLLTKSNLKKDRDKIRATISRIELY